MRYYNIVKAEFIDRPNRFIAHCKINDSIQKVHVKNTGRCKELLIPGAVVYVEKSNNPNRKTLYDLVAVEKGNMLINMDSQSPNKAAYEWIKNGGFLDNPTLIKPETVYKNSRFDFYVENNTEKAFIEVKGVTLENNGIACFPDAPTERGAKHLRELISAKNEGYRAAVLFVIQMKGVHEFIPNDITDKNFSDTLRLAEKSGVEIIAMDSIITPNSIKIDKKINVRL